MRVLDARTIVVISDRVDLERSVPVVRTDPSGGYWRTEPDPSPVVEGGYLERLPLALISAGRFDRVEIWHHVIDPQTEGVVHLASYLTRRAFYLSDATAPFANEGMASFFRARGAPGLLLVYGLGVSAEVLDAATGATIVYNSIDAPALRVPEEVSARFDMILTGARWQSREAMERHPEVCAPVLPVGPEFAAIDQFRPLGTTKIYDLVYVAAAQPYKRHDILFDAIDSLAGSVSALCVFGYGELAETYREEAQTRNLAIDFVMPPVLPYDQVNALVNQARIGVVAGFEDGAPAILTEYMLAGLPVLANAGLCCGLQYIRFETGMSARSEEFPSAIRAMLENIDRFRPRETALANWSWPVSVARFLHFFDRVRAACAPARHLVTI